jgi:hypothetical protein
MKQFLAILAMTAGISMAASSAHAHHSHPFFYDQCKSITIEGSVERNHRPQADSPCGRQFQLGAAPGLEPC